jgi:multidrug efflux system outer membrane protein
VFINGYNKEYALATPASVLAERPDIRAAGEEVKYRAALKDLAFADYYPKISVSALLGLESSKISNLVQGRSVVGNLAAGITAPIFDFGRIKARVKNADAVTEEALLNYEKTVLTAFTEVESAVNAIETNRKYFIALQKAYKSASLSVNYATERYKAGLSPYINVLEAQKNLNETSKILAESNANIIINHVRLFRR